MKRPRWLVVLLIILPLWLVVSGGIAVWFSIHRENAGGKVEQQRFVQSVSAKMIADDLSKLVNIIGERNGASESAAKNLTRAASMIEGALGPGNTGYMVHREKGPADWPLIHVMIAGTKPDLPAIWVLTSYDSRPGSPGVEANATGLAATLAAAQAMAGDQPQASVHFGFVPHANDPQAPILQIAAQFKAMAGVPRIVLCVEAMGAGDELWVSSRDASGILPGLVGGLGTVRGAEVVCLGDDMDLASTLFESGLPAWRVATRPIVTADDPDKGPFSAPVVAASATRLVELVRRCAGAR